MMGRLWTVVGMVLALALPVRAEVSRAEIEEAIDRGVVYLVGQQAADGHWAWNYPGTPEDDEHKRVGVTSVAVLALQNARSKRPEAELAIKKGLSYILQHPPEPLTYTAGLVEQVLYNASATEFRGPMATYAWMVCGAQKREGPLTGSWGYDLPVLDSSWRERGLDGLRVPNGRQQYVWSDNSNGQFAILALVFAERSGFQVPRVIWERARGFWAASQHKDGGWEYTSDQYRSTQPQGNAAAEPAQSTMTMTLAGTVSIYLCDEALADRSHKQCKTPEPDAAYEAGLEWIAKHWRAGGLTSYGWYAAERLGVLIGYSEFGGHDWFQEGVADTTAAIGQDLSYMRPVANTSFAVLFLARGRNPIIINKLKREGDWNLHRYDLSHLTEYISGPGQKPCQWRIVTLEAPVEFLLKVPMLWMSGHEALKFTAEEKAKLKEYVEKGGTILAEDCCSKKPFDESFRAMLKELWPEKELAEVPKTHAIYTSFRKLTNPPALMGMTMGGAEGRLGVIYMPNGISCKWEVGGAGAKGAMDFGTDIYLYVDKMVKQMKAEAAATPVPAGAGN